MHSSGQPACISPAKRQDPRALRTRAALQDALMQLLRQSTDWKTISIVGLCHRAGVARASFYEHYRGKADLLDDVFAAGLASITATSRAGAPLATLDWLAAHVAEAPRFFAIAMAGGRGDTLLPRFRLALTGKLTEELKLREVADAGLVSAYLIGGSMAYLAAAPDAEAARSLQRWATHLIRQS